MPPVSGQARPDYQEFRANVERWPPTTDFRGRAELVPSPRARRPATGGSDRSVGVPSGGKSHLGERDSGPRARERGRKSTSMLDPFNFLSGSRSCRRQRRAATRNGVGSFALESASISGVPVPLWMLQEIVTYIRSLRPRRRRVPRQAILLPSGIREIQLAKGQAIVVQ